MSIGRKYSLLASYCKTRYFIRVGVAAAVVGRAPFRAEGLSAWGGSTGSAEAIPQQRQALIA
jgi:hypothetical protein